MNRLMAALIVLGRIRGQSVVPQLMAKPYEATYQQLQSDLRGDRFPFDFATPSLQKRLLDYFEATFRLTDAVGLLQAAERDRQALRSLIWESTFTGLHSANKELRPLVEGYSEFELFVLNEVVISADPDSTLMEPEVVEIANRKFAQGEGAKFISYVSRRLELQRRKISATAGKGRAEPVNPAHLVVIRMWTDPVCPLWMTPSAGASKIINGITEQRLTNEGFNRLAATQNLRRISSCYLDKFFSVRLTDPAGLKLRNEFAETCEFSIDEVRRGRRKTGLIKETI